MSSYIITEKLTMKKYSLRKFITVSENMKHKIIWEGSFDITITFDMINELIHPDKINDKKEIRDAVEYTLYDKISNLKDELKKCRS